MMMNKTRVILPVLVLIIFYSITLTGCQLAIPTTGTELIQDKLCGVFVTIGYHNDLLNKEPQDIKVTTDSKGKPVLDTSGVDLFGEKKIEGKLSKEKNNVIFDGIKGYYMGILRDTDDTGEPYNVLMCDPGLSNTKYGVNVSEDSTENSCEATLYVNRDFNEVFYLNPVYLTSDGAYYMLLGSAAGTSFSADLVGTGVSCSQTLDTSFVSNINDSSKTEKDTYKVNVTVVDEVEKVIAKEMNQNDELISSTELKPESSDEFVVTPDTSYVIVEEIINNMTNNSSTKRSVYTPLPKDATEISNQYTCNFPGENGVVDPKIIKFIKE